MTKDTLSRETCEEKLKSAEMRSLNMAIQESLKSNEEYVKNHYEEFKNLLKVMTIDSFWSVQELLNKTCFTSLVYGPCPTVKQSIVVYDDLKVEAFSKNIKLRNVGKFHFPYNLTFINELDELICEFKLYQNNDRENNCSEIVDALHQLKEYVSDEKVNVIDFLADKIS
ncbi:hypothetical protein AVEN_102462-1, partial [Araneus ventricosus]